jgi:uncharacterized protein
MKVLVDLLLRGELGQPRFKVPEVDCRTVYVAMRDGVQLAVDLYLPPLSQAPTVVMMTPYGRDADSVTGAFLSFARRGYAVLAVDCRGTGESEPDSWDYYTFEAEDAVDVVQWLVQQQWHNGFIGACGGSYVGQTQWCMAAHPAMSAIAPQVSGLGIATNTANLYMLMNVYALSVGKGRDKVDVPMHRAEKFFERETLAAGYYNEPLHPNLPPSLLEQYPRLGELPKEEARRWLWRHYCTLSGRDRARFVKAVRGTASVTCVDIEALKEIFGPEIAHDRHALPRASTIDLCAMIEAPPLMITGWYDWGLNDALATWCEIRSHGKASVAERARLIIGPQAHNAPGYHEGVETHQELMRAPSLVNNAALLLSWYEAVQTGNFGDWPRVCYYLMGANEWRDAEDWPVPGARPRALYFGDEGQLLDMPPSQITACDRFSYDPDDPTPTVGGSIVSYLYPVGSVDVSAVQLRPDVLVYTTEPLVDDLDVVGPMQVVLHASSSASDTDFVARLSDVFPDGRAVQIQSGFLRTRFRNIEVGPELLVPERPYELKIDLWATANRFKAGHRLRLDISSADFPHYDRNSNRGGQPGPPVVAHQTVYRDRHRSSHLTFYQLP